MIVVAFDPGLKGAVAVMDAERERVLGIFDMPVAGGCTDPAALTDLMEGLLSVYQGEDIQAVIEKQSSRPRQKGVDKTMTGYGVILGVMAALHLRCEPVSPAAWKRRMKLSDDKGASIAAAGRMFPDRFADLKGPRGGMMDGRAEAMLIALDYVRHTRGSAGNSSVSASLADLLV